MLWVQKHAPRFEDVPHDTKVLLDFVANYSKQKKRALLLHGPAGTGKTAAVHALAKKLNLELVEVNASDYRKADEIELKIGGAVKQMSLFGTGKLILIDEVDGFAGNEDRGGIGAIGDILASSKYPIILVANDVQEQKLSSLKSKCVLVEFQALSVASMLPALKRVIDAQKIAVSDDLLKALARRSGGDLRGALIDLQVLSYSGLSMESLNTLHDRQRTEGIQQALVKILKSTDPALAVSALDSVEEDLDESLLWIDENLPKEYKLPADLARAYDSLSRADVFRGRIRRWQYWRFLVYVNVLMTAGVAVAKDKKQAVMVDYTRTQRLLKLWMAKQKYAKRQQVSKKLALASHCSSRKALQESMPNIQRLFKLKHVSAQKIGEELNLGEEEIEWLLK